MTVAKMLATDAGSFAGDRKPEVWALNEASPMGSHDVGALIACAQESGARLVLVGDVQQYGSVEAGRLFGQLYDAGVATFKLEQIVRQSNARTREAVEAMLAGDAEKAFAAPDAGGGRIVDQPDTQARKAVLARDFARLTRDERARTLVLDPTRQGRQELSTAFRAALVTDGTLGRDAMVATVLESGDLTWPHPLRRAAVVMRASLPTNSRSARPPSTAIRQ